MPVWIAASGYALLAMTEPAFFSSLLVPYDPAHKVKCTDDGACSDDQTER